MRDADARRWLTSARNDLRWAEVSQESGLFDRACFASQQAVEKVLKAFLVAQTNAYPRSHNLLDLLSLASKADASLVEYQSDCALLDVYYLPSRYPDIGSTADVGAEVAEEAIAIATRLVAAIDSRISGGD